MEIVQIGSNIHIKLILLVHKIFNQSGEWNKKLIIKCLVRCFQFSFTSFKKRSHYIVKVFRISR